MLQRGLAAHTPRSAAVSAEGAIVLYRGGGPCAGGVTPGGDLLAIFALTSQPHGADYRVAYSRSTDGGRSWSTVRIINGPEAKPGQVSAFGFPVISRRGRIYCFYNHGRAVGDNYQTSLLRCKYSDDDGHTWRPTEPLLNRDDGAPMLNPVSPCSIFALDDGRFLLMPQNHDSHGFGGRGPRDFHARRPKFIAVGEFRPNAHQPIWFSQPQLLFDTQNIGVFPFYMKWLSMYASITEHRGERILWYADRKIFGLGRYITDELLAPLTAPSG